MSAARLFATPRRVAEEAVTREPEFALLWAKHLAAEVQRARAQVEIISLKKFQSSDGFRSGVICLRRANGIGSRPRSASRAEALHREIARPARG